MICNKCQKPIEKDCASIPFCECLKILESEAAFWKERAERLKHTLEQFDHHPLAKDTLKAHTQAIEEREKAK